MNSFGESFRFGSNCIGNRCKTDRYGSPHRRAFLDAAKGLPGRSALIQSLGGVPWKTFLSLPTSQLRIGPTGRTEGRSEAIFFPALEFLASACPVEEGIDPSISLFISTLWSDCKPLNRGNVRRIIRDQNYPADPCRAVKLFKTLMRQDAGLLGCGGSMRFGPVCSRDALRASGHYF